MTDIVPILRDCAHSLRTNGGWKNTARYMSDAADEICTLRTDRDVMLAALKNLENDNGAIPAHAWDLVKAAIAKVDNEG